MVSFHIRTLLPADAQAVYSLHMRAILETCAPAYTPDVIREWISSITPEGYLKNQAKGESFHVALTQTGQAIGFSGWKSGTLCGLYIHPDFQGTGAGTALLKAAEDEAATRGTPITKLVATLNAMPFYRRHGYRVTTRSATTQNGVKIPRYYMKKA